MKFSQTLQHVHFFVQEIMAINPRLWMRESLLMETGKQIFWREIMEPNSKI